MSVDTLSYCPPSYYPPELAVPSRLATMYSHALIRAQRLLRAATHIRFDRTGIIIAGLAASSLLAGCVPESSSATQNDIGGVRGYAAENGQCVKIAPGGANVRTSPYTMDGDWSHVRTDNIRFFASGGIVYKYNGQEEGHPATAAGGSWTWNEIDVNGDGSTDGYVHDSRSSVVSCP